MNNVHFHQKQCLKPVRNLAFRQNSQGKAKPLTPSDQLRRQRSRPRSLRHPRCQQSRDLFGAICVESDRQTHQQRPPTALMGKGRGQQSWNQIARRPLRQSQHANVQGNSSHVGQHGATQLFSVRASRVTVRTLQCRLVTQTDAQHSIVSS